MVLEQLHLFGLTNTKTDAQGNSSHRTKLIELFDQLGRKSGSFSCDAGDADDIEKSSTGLSNTLGTFNRGGGGNKPNECQLSGCYFGDKFFCFLMRQVRYNQSCQTSGQGSLKKLRYAHPVNDAVTYHGQKRRFGMLSG